MSQNQIEKKLASRGCEQVHEVPLVLGSSLLHLIEANGSRDGREIVFHSATLYHRGDRYVFQWTRWDQSARSVRERAEDPSIEKTGEEFQGATHFDPNIETVAAGVSHYLTVNLEDSTIRIWTKGTLV
jgi:hypothetical protein